MFGPDHDVYAEGQFGLGKALLRAGRYAEAEPALLAAIAIKQKTYGADHWRIEEYIVPLLRPVQSLEQAATGCRMGSQARCAQARPASEN